MRTGIVYDEMFERHVLSPGHPESPERLRVAMKRLEEAGLLDMADLTLVQAQPADLEEVYIIHDREYIEKLRTTSEAGGTFFTFDTVSNEHTYDAALLAAGGGIRAVDQVLGGMIDNAYVLCRPPGHHAEYNRAFGFCFINNIAVAAQHLVRQRGLKRILIVDYDAHHGNGTQNAFYMNGKVFYVGIHQDGRTLFPGTGFADEIGSGRGRGYNANLPMMPGAGDKSYEIAIEELVEPIAKSLRPDFVLVSVGFDCHHKDPLTSLGLTLEGIAMINEKLVTIANRYAHGRISISYSVKVIPSFQEK